MGSEGPLNLHLNFQGSDEDRDSMFRWQERWKLRNTFVIHDTQNGTAGGVQAALLPPAVVCATSLFLSQKEAGIYHELRQ